MLRERPALTAVMDHYGLDYKERQGNQKIHCPDPNHEDRDASASLNLEDEVWQCFACGSRGDAITVICLMEGCSVAEAFERGSSLGTASPRQRVRGESPFSEGSSSRKGYKPAYRRGVSSGRSAKRPFA